MYQKHEQIIKNLLNKTLDKSLKWVKSVETTDQYLLSLTKGTILFDFFPDTKIYAFTILNSEGKQIDSIGVHRLSPLYENVEFMYDQIGRQINRTDETLDDILDEINSNK